LSLLNFRPTFVEIDMMSTGRMVAVLLLLTLSPGGVVSRQDITPRTAGEAYSNFADDGAWCWFADPRAVYRQGKIYGGWVDSQGSIWF
jgi:hypothetical protein